MKNEGLLCYVRDTRPPVPNRQAGELVAVYSLDQLVEVLRGFAAREPRVVMVSVPDGPQLFVGMGGTLAGVYAYPDRLPTRGQHRSWAAQASASYAAADQVFVSEGEPEEFEAAILMPVEEVIRIVTDAVEHRILPDTHAWVNAQGERYSPGEDDTGDGGASGRTDGIPF